MLGERTPIPLALYVHVPWCVRKCPYCDFNSHVAPTTLPERDYVEALLRDLEQDLPRVWGRRIESVFIGGGTPSLLSPEALDALLAGLRARLPLRPDLEITLEANPGSVERGRYAEFRATGITRLSIGVQSFNADALRALGRIHGPAEAIAAAEAAHAAGYSQFNLDLMFGLPGQDAALAEADLDQAIALAPTHISHYQLTLEPNTAFAHAPPLLPDDDITWGMQQQAADRLAAAGYAQYEVSAHARPGARCRHNLNYWEFGDYLGIGAGAHAKLSDPASGRIHRLSKPRHPRDYLAHAGTPAGIATQAVIAEQDLGFEFMMNALRLRDGVDAPLFTARTGLALEAIAAPLTKARALGLLDSDPARLRPTAEGLRYLNELLLLFLPDAPGD